jgi:hypothetical protein
MSGANNNYDFSRVCTNDVKDLKEHELLTELNEDSSSDSESKPASSLSYTNNNRSVKMYEIDRLIEEQLESSCSDIFNYIKQYSYDNGIPLGDLMTLGSLYDYIVTEEKKEKEKKEKERKEKERKEK